MLEIDWKPERSSTIPLHIQIYQYMRKKITLGEWPVGTKLPPQRKLARMFHVNRSTVVTALDELKASGLIETKVGSGTVVANNTWNVLASNHPPDWLRYVKSGIHQPNKLIIQEINKAEADERFIRLGTGELSPALLPNQQMWDLLKAPSGLPLHLNYMQPKGCPMLRKTVSGYLKQKGIEASPESILIVSGGLQALQLIAVGLLKRGSSILHETPSYLNSVHVFQSAGMKLFGVPLDDEGMKVESLSGLKKRHDIALLYTIPNFHNPTGTLMSEQRRKELLAICRREALPIIEDDVYGDLWLDGPPPQPLKASDNSGNVLYIGSISKSLSPGLRIGWIVGPEPVIERLADIKMQTDYGSSSLAQYVVNLWLSSGSYESFLEALREELKVRRDFMLQLLAELFSDVAVWQVPKGGFYIWLKIRAAISTRKLFYLALREGILLNPGHVYDEHDERHLRLSYSYASKEQLEDGLVRLRNLLKTYG